MKPIKEMNAVEAEEYLEGFPELPDYKPLVPHFASLTDAEKEKAHDFPFMKPDAFEKKWAGEPVDLKAILEFEPKEESPEETGFVPDVSEDPANEWQPPDFGPTEPWDETAMPDPEILQPDDDLPF